MKIAVCTHGAVGVLVLYKLFELGFVPDDIIVFTHDTHLPKNKALINFLQYFNVNWFIVGDDMEKLATILDSNNVSMLINVAYKFIFKQPIFDLKHITLINLHPGILPNYRGWFSIPWAILNEEEYVGYTYHLISPEIDRGDIICIERFPILKSSTSFSLHFPLINDAINKLEYIISRTWGVRPQTGGGKYYKRILPNDGYIDPSWDENKIDRFIRAMYFPPFRGALLKTGRGDVEILTYKQYLSIKE